MNISIRLLFSAIFLLFSTVVKSQIPLPLNTVVTEDFGSLGTSDTATLPTGWRMTRSNALGLWPIGINTTLYAAASGVPLLWGRYNFGTTTGTDRALGFLIDGSYTYPSAIMAYYKNNTGAAISAVTVSFAIERYVVSSAGFSLSFASSTDGIIWTDQGAGDIAYGIFNTSGVPFGTFAAPMTVTRTLTVNVAVPINGDIYFRWQFNTTNTAPQGIGLDDVAVFAKTAQPGINSDLDANSNVYLYPNPVSTIQNVNLRFTKMKAGNYIMILFNCLGQQVYRSTLNHAGGSADKNVNLPGYISKGTYQLQLIGNTYTSSKLLSVR